MAVTSIKTLADWLRFRNPQGAHNRLDSMAQPNYPDNMLDAIQECDEAIQEVVPVRHSKL